jgi:protein-S-isoprenylcysteine O-methyltransferase Ste14
MRASAIEFRLRMAINVAIVLLGFWSPWTDAWGIGRRLTLLEWLPLELSRLGVLSFSAAATTVIVAGALVAALGAFLRVWGSACLGPGTVLHTRMLAASVVADGPYRYVRNPLYLGLWCTIAAVSLLMPPTGALCTMALLTFFLVRLTLGEEAFLAERLGEPYQAYLRSVPRFYPRLRTALPRGAGSPHWFRALQAELAPIGVFVALAFFSWSYDSRQIGKTIVIAFGASLVARAVLPAIQPASDVTTKA